MAGLTEQTMILTQSQKHWRAWVSALQTKDDKLRAVALEQLTKFLNYWTAELYDIPPIRGLVNGHDTSQPESWDEVFNVDTELLMRPKKTQVHFEQDEAWLGPYGLDEATIEEHHIEKRPSMNPWDNEDGSKETRDTLSRYFCGIQRLVIDCPFADVRRSCRKLLDTATKKNVEIPSLVNEGPSWLIPLPEIIGFKTDHHNEPVSIQIAEKYISDESSSSSDSDIDFGSRPDADFEESTTGYGYYTSPDATPRPMFTTPAIPINAPPRSRSRNRLHHLNRNTSSDSIAARSTSSSHKSSKREYVRQRHATKDIREFQIASFIAHGRVTNYAKVLFYMPRYVRCSSTCHEKLISSTKGISRSIKTFTALIASAEMGCQYFVSYFTAKYLEVGGNHAWLRGLGEAPGKMTRIAELSRLLVQEPWKITANDMKTMMESKEVDGTVKDGWSSAELVWIIAILAMFHAQSSIALGLGVVCEADLFGGTVWRRISRNTAHDSLEDQGPDESSSGHMERGRGFDTNIPGGRKDILDKLRWRMLSSSHLSPDMSFDNLQNLRSEAIRREDATTKAAEAAFLEALHSPPVRPTPSPSSSSSSQQLSKSLPTPANSDKTPTFRAPQPDVDPPINPIIEQISRFTIRKESANATVFPSSSHPILSTHTYSWDDTLHFLQSHLPDLANNFDKRFHLPPTRSFLQPTPYTDPIDVTPFKEALQNYSLALIGVMREGYNYKSIREFLCDEITAFIRRVCLNPRGTTRRDWDGMRRLGFPWAEIVEIVVMVCEARFIGVLMYNFKALGDL